MPQGCKFESATKLNTARAIPFSWFTKSAILFQFISAALLETAIVNTGKTIYGWFTLPYHSNW
jgi:hypothetical protein